MEPKNQFRLFGTKPFSLFAGKGLATLGAAIFAFLALWGSANGQSQQITRLQEVVDLATTRSPGQQIAEVQYSNAYWRFQSFRSQYRPRIDLDATLPDFFRALDVVTQPTGEDLFVQRSQVASRLGLRLEQIIPFTGGTLLLGSDLQLISQLGSNRSTSFLTTPVNLSFVQPLFRFNPFRWERITAPLELEVAEKRRLENHASLAVEATRLFFDLLQAQVNEEAATENIEDTDSLFQIGQRRFESGRIPKAELLQLRLNKMNAENRLAENSLLAQTTAEQLRAFLGQSASYVFDLDIPDQIPDYEVDIQRALLYAQRFRAEVVRFKLQMEEAKRDMAQARSEAGLNADLFASFGLSQTAPNLADAYSNPVDQERVRLGLTIPLADWGKARAAKEVARTNLELTRMLIGQDSLTFERDIVVRIQQLNLIRTQVTTAAVVYELAREHLKLTQDRYTSGKVLLTEYNLAIQEENNARFSYINALREFWLAHFEVQGLTMYDFEKGEPLLQKYPKAE